MNSGSFRRYLNESVDCMLIELTGAWNVNAVAALRWQLCNARWFNFFLRRSAPDASNARLLQLFGVLCKPYFSLSLSFFNKREKGRCWSSEQLAFLCFPIDAPLTRFSSLSFYAVYYVLPHQAGKRVRDELLSEASRAAAADSLTRCIINHINALFFCLVA